MKSTAFVVFALLLTFSANAGEEEINQKFCKRVGGKIEHRNSDKTRVDCLLRAYAVEVDFASKWYECVGQALHYSLMTRKTPACALIVESELDYKKAKRAKRVVRKFIKGKFKLGCINKRGEDERC